MTGRGARIVGVRAAVALSAALLAACGDGSADSTTSAAPIGSTNAPATGGTSLVATVAPLSATLTGNASTTATSGSPYTFTPVLNGGAATAYTVVNKPSWATFDILTGALTGTPAEGDVGTYADIAISSTVGGQSIALDPFRIVVAATVAPRREPVSATMSWNPPTENTDGSALSDLAGYRIYYGTSEASPDGTIEITNPGLTAYTVSNLSAGTYFFAIAALNTDGVEGQPASIGSITVM